jgi:hypothetical protein
MINEFLSSVTEPEAFYINLFNAFPGNSILLKADAPKYTIIAVTNDYLQLLRIQKEKLIGRGFFDAFHSIPAHPVHAGEKNFRTSLDEVLKNKEPHQLPVQSSDPGNEKGNQTKRYWTSINTPVLSNEGNVAYIIHTTSEITSQVKAEQKIESTKGIEKAYNFFMNAPVIIGFLKGDEYLIELANEGLLEVWGRTTDVVGKPLLKAIPELEEQGFIALMEEVRTTGKPFYAYEYPITLYRQGKEEVLYFDFVYKPFYEDERNRKASGVISVGFDVTERVAARRMVKESAQELALAMEIADLGSFRIDLLANRVTNSEKINDWFGFHEPGCSREEMFQHIHPDDYDRVENAIQDKLHSEADSRHDLNYRVIHPVTGNVRHLRSVGKTLFDEQGKPYLIIGIIQDITPQVLHQKKLEDNEVELQKKVTERTQELENLNEELKRSNSNLEEFAYAASHDMKEPIRKINLFADRLKQQLGDKLDSEQSHLFSRMEHAARRMNMLIDDLLTYSHVSKGASHFELVDLNQKLTLVQEDLELEIEEKQAKIVIGNLPAITGHKRQLQQLFQNLISNALKYGKPGVLPEVGISANIIRGSETALSLKGEQAAKRYHHIRIKDNGIGFKQEDAERIFNVFTRLHGKEEYKGTGVGLSIARKVVENHNGFIWAESAPGEGAIFNVLLPAD